ncbi:MAG TPA: undecaprenyldiphospho-muramoylpentapeptide beta-N-acetylglucosaminyltransferase [Terriglobales bacterium]|jgi:UDP-N-acetylglucosamine--N-acetylmuramyl-(pentapeptide) pyrophosphoryl-undecaprenol N-acetylglucosamine transferase|nr:undecaprenyldiphospho-muramoylpentapeptide beta-N-acetylglucosaminyltransferase [Terriglobales bacterium]
MRAILAGGGTGGHVIPALAIAQELRSRYSAEVVFVGTARGIENRLVPAAGFRLALVQVGALKNVGLATRVRTLFDLPRAVVRSWGILNDFRAQVVIGVGGYASGPAMLAAALSGAPTLAFEPNFVPGFANRVVAPMVSAAAVHFPETAGCFRGAVVTGVPVRRQFFDIPPRPAGALPTLLAFGGSQGATALNRTLAASLPVLIRALPGLHILHQTGERDYNDAQAAYLQAGISAEVSPFIDDMPGAFARADLLLCRSGASTVAEVTAAGKPAVFVPFPRAADDHQRRNAEALAQAGAALVIPEAELTAERLVETVSKLMGDRGRLAAMGAAARRLAHPDAARTIAEMAARLAGQAE